MGLGYTAIQAAQTALEVVTIELEPTVVEVCRLNPWSQSIYPAAYHAPGGG
jgi:predicted methyltransferase